jgi:hypothetical protein
MPNPTTSLDALAGRADLQQYGNNRLVLFALELSLNLEDIHAVAATAVTDAPNDKKCDLVYVDRDLGKIIVAQGYLSVDNTKQAAPANKASDLNTAAAWLLSRHPETLSDPLQSAAQEVDDAIADGVITDLEFWYCHNLPESQNVQDELAKVEHTANSLLDTNYPGHQVETTVVREVGRATLDGWYRASQVPILVTDEFDIPISGGFREIGDKWQAFCTSVPAAWLGGLFASRSTNLFSANVRDYLGSRRSDRNINHNIKETAKSLPQRFWAYNNGLTALVNDYRIEQLADGDHLVLSGMSIVNGAQTTGALGSVAAEGTEALAEAKVLARFVKCSDVEVIRDVIRFNNSQNMVEPSDFRSNDATQDRLRSEFDAVPDADYRGGRRGSEKDLIQRPTNLLPSNTVAQALAAFIRSPTLRTTSAVAFGLTIRCILSSSPIRRRRAMSYSCTRLCVR